jgi:radical SAM-linked protein
VRGTGEGLRFRYSKLGRIRFTSQRDVARMWERALRRTDLEVAWSAGFSPRPLLSFGLALPTGCESTAEYIDVRLAERLGAGPRADELDGLAGLAGQLTEFLPEGLQVDGVGTLAHGAGSLQQEVTSCTWILEVRGVAERELTERIGRLLAAPRIPVRRERKGRQTEDDLRPSVLALDLAGPGPGGSSPPGIVAELATQPRGVRPTELLEGLGADLVLVRARRTNQWIEHDGERREPLARGHRPPPGAAFAHGWAS